ncbi:zinc finger matrin-type protein 5 [Copidosoma floridanum]|uniref:zinc finger matrin-type protein 5 n=1 Tax=Copidosoma floridanum TaxID=29053 RepID=UPI0006C9A0AE|nr:zinc finger matrin-type protein 5 [Copidosoma floridanum]
MGGKHYYCEYCDRSFKDEAGVRKKHLASIQHVKNRENHYRQFRDPKQILQEELAKKPCKRFLNNGECHFGHLCKFSHCPPYYIQQLQAAVAASEQAKHQRVYPEPEFIVKEFFDSALDPEELVEENLNPWPLSDEYKEFENSLPISMRPMTLKDFDSADFAEWGKQ